MTSSTRHDPSHGPGRRPNGPIGLRSSDRPEPSPLAEPRGGTVRAGTLSILVPAKNEAASLPQLLDEIARAFRPLVARGPGAPGTHRLDAYEVIVIDDGSTDDTAAVLGRLAAGEHPELRALRFRYNAGQSAATAAGFRAAAGDWVAILDADLQNPPAELARLWDALPGHDAALGWRIKREDKVSKRWISRVANRVRHWVLGDSVKDTGCAVRIFPRDVALRFPMFHGAHRFYGSLLLREGCRIVQVPVEHRPRPHGQSHYNVWNRSLNVMVDLLGAAWLMRRPVRYEVVEEPSAATAAQGAWGTARGAGTGASSRIVASPGCGEV